MKKTSLLLMILIIAVLSAACDSSASKQASSPTPVPTTASNPTYTTPGFMYSLPGFQYSSSEYRDGLKSDGKIHVYLVGNGETVKAKDSTSIRSMTYYEESEHLIINFNGKEYAFANVSSSLWNSFKEASSSDTFYSSHFKGDKSYWINDYNGSNGDLIVMENVGSNNLFSGSANNSRGTNSSNSETSKHRYEPSYAMCVACENTYSTDEMWEVGGDYICESCLDGGDYAECERCGELFHIDDMYYVDGYLCEGCVEELSEEYDE